MHGRQTRQPKPGHLPAAAMAFIFLSFASLPVAQGNTLINNSASGYIGGSLVQKNASGIQRGSEIYIGAIVYGAQGVQNVHVSATVTGSVVAPAGTTVSIGSHASR